MRRLALALAVVPFVALAAVPALACKPAPPRAPETVRVEPTPPPRIDPGFDLAPAPRPPVNPWSAADGRRFDRLLDLVAAAIETVEPHKDSVQAAKAALLKAIALHRTTVAELIVEGKAISARMQEQPEGFQQYIMTRIDRIQRMSEALGKLTPTQQQAMTELFAG